ncbi:hypothetical protein PHISCL_00199 [Aspergillus sclerotialis]|uniref:PPIase cyclophilin-type domain-containing protein n=1 Tax=Aspergillus sclerotialis TaxID=2070753 RepID=A0A3A3ABU2_9EURO|nr:hypothetical protein PHISCL_00199 [Aspergillus sclerotialis]
MSAHYSTEPAATAVSPDFVIQGGDPTGTGSGGTSIYEYPEFEYDPEARDPNEKVVLRDELHSRLRFNRRGLLGMAKSEDGTYGSQFFITLANTERELNGQCTMFGRVEGDSIFNVLKIAEAERIEGTETPVYPVQVTSCEVGELGPLAGKLKKRQIVATAGKEAEKPAPKKKKKNKGGKTLLSFGDEGEGEGEMPVRPAKPKFNPKLVSDTNALEESRNVPKAQPAKEADTQTRKRPRSPSLERSPSAEPKNRPKSPDPLTQLPLPRAESPARSPPRTSPAKPSTLSRTNAEIESLKASMRRTNTIGAAYSDRPKSALEAMIPTTAIRGRKRPPPGAVTVGRGSATNGVTGFSSSDNDALRIFNAFKSKLEQADSKTHAPTKASATTSSSRPSNQPQEPEPQPEEEEQLCDLHFIANCQSCQSWDNPDNTGTGETAPAEEEGDWMNHELRFGKDTLGKDLSWKKDHPDDADSLMVIDPREKEKEIVGGKGKKRGFARDRERDRKREKGAELEWERSRR